MLEKLQNCILFSEHTMFLSAGILLLSFFSRSFHPAAPGLIGGTLIYGLNQSLIIIYIA